MNLRRTVLLVCFAATWAAAQPVVSSGGVLNAASYAMPGLPSSGIAQGSMFVVFGTGLGPQSLQKIDRLPLPVALAGTSITVSVNGKSTAAYLFYTSALQLAAVMPSTTPVGSGTLTVTYRGVTSAPVPVQVVRNAPGILTLNSAGYGPAALQNYNSASQEPVNTVVEAAHPGQTEVLWATGLGPIAGNDSSSPPVGNLPFQVQVFVGGKVAHVTYAGRSAEFPGIDQIAFEVPAGVAGCQVPVALKVEAAISNFGTMAVTQSGNACSDWHGFSAEETQRLGSATTRVASVVLGQSRSVLTTPCGTTTTIAESFSARFYLRNLYQTLYGWGPKEAFTSLGSCTVYNLKANDSIHWIPNDPAAGSQAMYAGANLSLLGPNGSAAIAPSALGAYTGALTAQGGAEYLLPGVYTLNNGAGSEQVGLIEATLTMPQAITWTNPEAAKSIVRTQPLTVTWSGGDAAREYALIEGAALDPSTGAMAAFLCSERLNSGQFTIPVEVLSALPAADAWTADGYPAGFLSVGALPALNSTRFHAPGLDVGYFAYARQEMRNVSYK